jgi:hypothetical protein
MNQTQVRFVKGSSESTNGKSGLGQGQDLKWESSAKITNFSKQKNSQTISFKSGNLPCVMDIMKMMPGME